MTLSAYVVSGILIAAIFVLWRRIAKVERALGIFVYAQHKITVSNTEQLILLLKASEAGARSKVKP